MILTIQFPSYIGDMNLIWFLLVPPTPMNIIVISMKYGETYGICGYEKGKKYRHCHYSAKEEEGIFLFLYFHGVSRIKCEERQTLRLDT